MASTIFVGRLLLIPVGRRDNVRGYSEVTITTSGGNVNAVSGVVVAQFEPSEFSSDG